MAAASGEASAASARRAVRAAARESFMMGCGLDARPPTSCLLSPLAMIRFDGPVDVERTCQTRVCDLSPKLLHLGVLSLGFPLTASAIGAHLWL